MKTKREVLEELWNAVYGGQTEEQRRMKEKMLLRASHPLSHITKISHEDE